MLYGFSGGSAHVHLETALLRRGFLGKLGKQVHKKIGGLRQPRLEEVHRVAGGGISRPRDRAFLCLGQLCRGRGGRTVEFAQTDIPRTWARLLSQNPWVHSLGTSVSRRVPAESKVCLRECVL